MYSLCECLVTCLSGSLFRKHIDVLAKIETHDSLCDHIAEIVKTKIQKIKSPIHRSGTYTSLLHYDHVLTKLFATMLDKISSFESNLRADKHLSKVVHKAHRRRILKRNEITSLDNVHIETQSISTKSTDLDLVKPTTTFVYVPIFYLIYIIQ